MRSIFTLAVISFIFHLIWENLQAPLYAGYVSLSQHFEKCLWGTYGDVAITLAVFGIVMLLKGRIDWMQQITWRDLLAFAIVGFFVAIWIEHRALLFVTWNYASAMPIIPYFRVGLSPIIQMTLLLPLSFLATARLLKRFG